METLIYQHDESSHPDISNDSTEKKSSNHSVVAIFLKRLKILRMLLGRKNNECEQLKKCLKEAKNEIMRFKAKLKELEACKLHLEETAEECQRMKLRLDAAYENVSKRNSNLKIAHESSNVEKKLHKQQKYQHLLAEVHDKMMEKRNNTQIPLDHSSMDEESGSGPCPVGKMNDSQFIGINHFFNDFNCEPINDSCFDNNQIEVDNFSFIFDDKLPTFEFNSSQDDYLQEFQPDVDPNDASGSSVWEKENHSTVSGDRSGQL